MQPVLGGFDQSRYATERLWAKAKDGTQVPISLVYRKDLWRQDGSSPMLLDGWDWLGPPGCSCRHAGSRMGACLHLLLHCLCSAGRRQHAADWLRPAWLARLQLQACSVTGEAACLQLQPSDCCHSAVEALAADHDQLHGLTRGC